MSGSGKTPGQAARSAFDDSLASAGVIAYECATAEEADAAWDDAAQAAVDESDSTALAELAMAREAISDLAAERVRLRAGLADEHVRAEDYKDERDQVRAELTRLRELLDEIGVMAANAPEDGDSFGLLEEIAMRIAADGVIEETGDES